MAEEHHPILLYDGHCALCNGWVRILLALDTAGELRFAKLQSNRARELLRSHQLDPESMDTVVLVESEPNRTSSARNGVGNPPRVHLKSDALLGAVAHLNSPWKYLRYARFLPRAIRDRIYEFIARHRYAWFGRYESCPLPSPPHRGRFLDSDENRRSTARA